MNDEAEKVILLVDDCEDDAFLTEMALQSAGVQNRLFVASDGQKALDYLSGTGEFSNRQQFPFPSLVFLDIKLPYRSGLEILAWLKKQTHLPATVMVVLTGSNEPDDFKAAYESGAKLYLVKPLKPQMICDMIKEFKLDWLRCDPPEAGK